MPANESLPKLTKRLLVNVAAFMLAACQAADAQRGLFNFERIVLDEGLSGAYGVKLADVDGDGLVDVLALANDPAQLIWYRNPDWQSFTIGGQFQDAIDAAAHDIDGDGDIDVALISEFSFADSSQGGVLQWLENPGDPAADASWASHYIDETPTSHRIRWLDLNADGRLELLNLPIMGRGAEPPLYNVGLEIKAYAIPPNPRSTWPGVIVDRSLQLSHGLTIEDWDYDGRQDVLTASLGGIHVFQLAKRSVTVAKTLIAAGNQQGERPAIGAGEVAVGEAGSGNRFIATIEPWHGSEVAVYTRGATQLWNRQLIDPDLAGGHALQVGDLNGDGVDEIVAGGRAEPFQLNIYSQSADGWRRDRVSRGEVAVSGLALHDLDGDGLLDIVAIGSASENLMLFRNTGP